ncbi:MAG: hypothetical protein WD712_01170 [Candidatus Spechtbacterales bacterium]
MDTRLLDKKSANGPDKIMRRVCILLIVIAAAIIMPASAQAIDYPAVPAPVPGGSLDLDCLQLPNGGLKNASGCTSSYRPPATIGTLVLFVFAMALWAGGFIALVSLIYTGGQFVFSGQSPPIRAEAKKRLQNVILGMLILLSTTVVLNTINPDLTRLGLNLDNVDTETTDSLGVPSGEDDPLDKPGTYSCYDPGTGTGCGAISECTQGYFVPDGACSADTTDCKMCYERCVAEGGAPGLCREAWPPCEDPSNLPINLECELGTFDCIRSSGKCIVANDVCPYGYEARQEICNDAGSDCGSPSFIGISCLRIDACGLMENEKDCEEKTGCDWGGGWWIFGDDCGPEYR